jgi:hypothetical protein
LSITKCRYIFWYPWLNPIKGPWAISQREAEKNQWNLSCKKGLLLRNTHITFLCFSFVNPFTCLLQVTLVHFCQTSSLLPGDLPIVASACLRLLYSEHINHIQVLGFLPFPYSSCAHSPLSMWPMYNITEFVKPYFYHVFFFWWDQHHHTRIYDRCRKKVIFQHSTKFNYAIRYQNWKKS